MSPIRKKWRRAYREARVTDRQAADWGFDADAFADVFAYLVYLALHCHARWRRDIQARHSEMPYLLGIDRRWRDNSKRAAFHRMRDRWPVEAIPLP